MKSLITLLLIITFCIPSWSQDSATDNETTTYYFIRHAEKDRTDKTNRNPELNKLGKKRAKKWCKYFKNVDFDAIYSTNYNRTQQTAAPTAKKKKLTVLDYDPRTLYSEDFAKATKGKTVLVVGHSNTTPAFVNMVLGNKKHKDIDDNDNTKLFIVTISGEKITDEVLTIN
jgi:broad specificity phosphatase PhoE|nr:phosphoglycerate mutase family protein [uncultured Psychroserpens sp.]